jgi:hypothetical protein
LFSGRRPRRVITTKLLREWAAERVGLPLWLLNVTRFMVIWQKRSAYLTTVHGA